MTLLPKVSDRVQKEIYKDLAQGALKRFGGAIEALAEMILDLPRRPKKSPEELALDHIAGSEAEAHRRRLAIEALARIPPERRTFPPPQILGPILRDVEFEPEGTPIWEMWSQLLSSASDTERVSGAHPAFPRIIGSRSMACWSRHSP